MIVVLMILTCGSFSVSAKENQGFHFEQINMNENAESYEAVLTDGKGNLWQLYPNTKKMADHVQKYGREGDEGSFFIDTDGALYMYGKKWMENVSDCIWNGEYTYILKKDGVLLEKTAGDNSNYRQVKTGIREIDTQRYLTQSGELYSYYGDIETGEKEAERVAELSDSEWISSVRFMEAGYQDEDGYYHSEVLDGEKIGDQPMRVKEVYEPSSWESEEHYIYLFTEDDELWKAKEEKTSEYPYRTFPKAELVSRQVVSCNWMGELFRTENGKYYTLDGSEIKAPSEENPIAVKDLDFQGLGANLPSYQLIDTSSGSLKAVKDGMEVLDHVSDIYVLLDYSYTLNPPYRVYALDEYNKVWEITESPKQILNLNENAPSGGFGDINEDGKINMKDARIALKAAVGSETLNEEQQKPGDVDNDGKVGMKDARLILKYAVGSIIEF